MGIRCCIYTVFSPSRDCQGFQNPPGVWGKGKGWDVHTLAKSLVWAAVKGMNKDKNFVYITFIYPKTGILPSKNIVFDLYEGISCGIRVLFTYF